MAHRHPAKYGTIWAQETWVMVTFGRAVGAAFFPRVPIP